MKSTTISHIKLFKTFYFKDTMGEKNLDPYLRVLRVGSMMAGQKILLVLDTQIPWLIS
jgi:hypothetical protein